MLVFDNNLLGQIADLPSERLVVSGNKPFPLADPQAVWLVQAGRVQVFAVQIRQGQPVEARYHICTVGQGEAFFGLDSDHYRYGLLAVASVNTELLKIPLSYLLGQVPPSPLAGVFGALLDNWLEKLSLGITHDILPGRDQLTLEPGVSLEITASQKIGAKKGGLWVRVYEGDCLFLGQVEVSLGDRPVYIPLYGQSWLQLNTASRIRTATTTELLAEHILVEGLEFFYDIFLQVVVTNIQLETYDEINRLRKKAEYDLEVGQEAVSRLSGIAKKERGGQTDQSPPSKDALQAACRQVGQAQGITIIEPLNQDRSLSIYDRLEEIARASHMRIRQVTLEPGWWQRDNGPLLGFRRETSKPLALLPVSDHAYQLIDPAANRTERVTAQNAPTIDTAAVNFYRPFPARALGVFDLIKFGLRGSRNTLLITFLLGAAGGILALFVPLLTGYLFDTVIPSGQPISLLQIFLGLLVVSLVGAIFQFTRALAVLRLETNLDVSLQAAVWDRVLSLPATFFRDFTVGDLAIRAMGINQIRQLIGSNIISALLSSLFSVFSLLLLFTFGLEMALLALGLTVITLLVIGLLSLGQLKYQRQLAEIQGKIAGLVLQQITGIAKLRVAGAEVRAFGLWARKFSQQRKLAFKVQSIDNWLVVFTSTWPIITLITIFATFASISGVGLSTGRFLIFLAAFTQFLAAMITLSNALIVVLQAIPVYERSKIILNTLPETTELKADPGELGGAIEINQLSFRYSPDTPLILNDISLEIKPGQFVAIVGPSGSGKSSLFRLLLGFEKPETGSIYYNQQDLDGLDVQRVRRQIGVVLQNGKLMAGDIFSNIAGSAPFSHDDAWEAARMAGLDQDIKNMPMGMLTMVSEGGSTLSGGQRQRLMIARAIIARPRILLFDEATSALDNQTQAIVSQSLENLQATRLVIAHRLSTVINADKIFVIQAGKISQAGTYQELMQQPGLFRELATRQLV